MKETEYRRLRCPRCGFKADRDVIGKLNKRKGALKMLGIKANPGGSLTTLHSLQMTDVSPNRWGGIDEPPKGNPRPLGRGGGQPG